MSSGACTTLPFNNITKCQQHHAVHSYWQIRAFKNQSMLKDNTSIDTCNMSETICQKLAVNLLHD